MQQIVNDEYAALFAKKPRYVFLMGGRGAGRSTVASQYAASSLVSQEYFRCAIMRYVLSDIRNSIFQEIKDRFVETEEIDHININEQMMTLSYGRNQINAIGFKKSSKERKSKLKSLANYNCIIIEEGDEIPEEDFIQLDDSVRTIKGDITIIFMLNAPPKTHWIIKRWFRLKPSKLAENFYVPFLKKERKNDTLYIRTSYRNNARNLSEQTKQNYESYRYTKPAHYWNMIRGLVPETVIGKIYSGWELIDKIPEEAEHEANGLDFGYTNDPTAIIAIYRWNDAYVVDQVEYKKGMKNNDIAEKITPENVLTIADSAEPKSIDELRTMNISVNPSKKGKGSVSHGIDSVQSKKIYVTARSKKIWEEYENYSFFIDKDGNITNDPDQACQDHAMDAIRYAVAFLNPIKKYKSDYEQPEHVVPSIGPAKPTEPLQTIAKTSREDFLKKLAKTRKRSEEYQSDAPWQPPGLR